MLSRGIGSIVASAGVVVVLLVAGCQMQTVTEPVRQHESDSPARVPDVSFELHDVWGGQVRCGKNGCLLGAIEHEKNQVTLHRLEGRTVRLLDRQPVGYHPDSAAWLADDILAAAVEITASIDIFKVENDRLRRVHQAIVGFPPRNVILLGSGEGQYRLLATPYSGNQVAWIQWRENNHEAAKVQKSVLCRSPWHPVRVQKWPGHPKGGVAVGCLDDRQVVVVDDSDPALEPQVLARFSGVPRQVRPSPSGLWLYVALETGGRNARIHMETGELQWIASDPSGSSAVAPLADDFVIWGDDRKLVLQRLDGNGVVQASKYLRTSGYSTILEIQDVDQDGHRDVVVLNSAGTQADVFYGPLWERALPMQ